MRVVFLDFDGVLNNSSSMFTNTYMPGALAERLINANPDPVSVKLLDYLLIHTDARIVVSSSWRNGCRSHLELQEILRDAFKLTHWDRVIGMTQYSTRVIRGVEIDNWVQAHPEITHYVIIDDDSDMMDHQQEHFVHTNHDHGFKIKDCEQAFACLGLDFVESFQKPEIPLFERL